MGMGFSEAIDEQLRQHNTGNKKFGDDGIYFDEEAAECDAVSGEKQDPLIELYGQYEGYMSQVLGFNSAKYDLNLVKRCIAKQLNLHDPEQKGSFVVQKM